MRLNIVIRTIMPQIEGVYSSFPTITEYDNKLYIFYHQGIKSGMQCHGVGGKVKCFEIEKGLFVEAFDD